MQQEIMSLKNQLIDYAISVCDRGEACGYIVRKDNQMKFIPCENIHQEPFENFAIAAKDYAIADQEGELVAVFHSHVEATIHNGKMEFSQADRIACEESGLMWVLAILPFGELKFTAPSGYMPPLIGREFCYGISDCYSLVRDIYRDIGIQLNNYPRGYLDEWNTVPDWDMYEENFAKEGFIEVDKYGKLQKYDVLLMQIQSQKINHVAVMWDCDRNVFIHHLIDRLSEESIYGGYWQRCTIKIVRHSSLFDAGRG
jgi:proteasome lid subunit RPN8/RPN11